jgi:Phage capsid family
MAAALTSRRLPLVPEDLKSRPSDHLCRALLAVALCHLDETAGSVEAVARRLWPDDPATMRLITRAASSPADTLTPGWAAELAQSALVDLIQTLGPTYCAGELFRRAMALRFGTSAAINVPGIVASANDAAWVAQGAPMPVRQLSVGTGAQLVPKTLRTGFVVTRELLEHSTPNAERMIRAQVSESIGCALDAAVFDAAASSATRPAGLRNGVSATTAATGGGDAAMLQDLGALAAAVAAVGGLNIAFVASPGEAVAIALRAGADFNARFAVFASGGLAAGMVMAVALPALASAIDPAVRFDVAREAAAHMEDTSPLQLGTSGSPNVVAAPTRSLWQSDCIGMRLRLEASWGLRASGSVSWLQSATW